MNSTIGAEPVRETLADRLRRVRAATFAGRDEEIALFRSALHRDGPVCGFAVLYIWGAGGVGKSALLRRLGDEAEAAGRVVVRVDAHSIERSPAGFAEATGEARKPGRILLIDTFEAGQGLEGWFWDDFLPGLPADTLVVVASRHQPDPTRSRDPEWSTAVHVLRLGELSRADAAELLRRRGVPASLGESLYAFAGGHPLALVLAAEVAGRNAADVGHWPPHEPAIKMLLDRLVGDLPSAGHRRALEICAHVMVTREDLLRSIFGERGAELFAWLREQPFIEAGRHGLRPHELVRDLLIADLRWRDPEEWRELQKQVRPYFVERALTATGPDMLTHVAALKYLHRYGDTLARFITWRGRGEVYEDAYRPEDRDAVLRMAGELDGPEGATLVDFWLRRQPEAFRVCRRPGFEEPVAYVCWLRLYHPDTLENATDPVIGDVWAHVLETAPPRPGTKVAVQRFINVRGGEPEVEPLSDLLFMRGAALCMREPDLAWTYLLMPNPDFWEAAFDYLGHVRLTGDLAAAFAHDWQAIPVRPWLDTLQERLLHGPNAPSYRPAATVPSRPDFERAVRDLLRTWRHRPSVEANPLINTALGGEGPLADRVEALRGAVEEAVDAMQGTARGDKLHRTLAVTFFHGTLTQEAAAERIGVAFGTYRHRLAAAIDEVAEELWQRATGVSG
ncbi:ATP-binding protein [Actinoplanes sp. NPDC051851]|uniref:ATP-binding protein n=1 Tax=Actinoplanes sp. NPDC051851 TaxID=3154753 RepID=UPI00342FCEA3